ncbi:MAG: hypothetical protein LBJ01_11075, partial [Tannerella sp.]|nr:hypothetical protein [Tannerella sp.]
GPDRFFPVKREERDNQTARVHSVKNETRDAWFYPTVNGDEIWVQYSGRAFDPDEQNQFLNSRIIIFDRKGKPVRQIITDIPFYALAIDKASRAFYGVTIHPDFTLVRFNY